MRTLLVLLLFATPAAAQPTAIDHLTPAFPDATARRVADAASWGTALVPVIFDAKESWDAADRSHALTLMGTRIGVTYGLGFIVKKIIHRDRPCIEEGCGIDNPHYSFYSLHTALPFTALGGPRLAIVLPFAVSTGGLRIAANKHWLTDVLAGAGVGALTSRIR